jgi:hypothetical protein
MADISSDEFYRMRWRQRVAFIVALVAVETQKKPRSKRLATYGLLDQQTVIAAAHNRGRYNVGRGSIRFPWAGT